MSVLKLEVLADPSKFRAGMSAMQKDLYKLRRTTDVVGRSMNRALGAVGLGMGISKLTGFLKESARAAAEDTKSKNQLALALRNTLGATVETTNAAERYIQSLSNQVAVLDDDLRPALATAIRSTGSLAKGSTLLETALNVSAGTGKDLGSVTNAMSKAYNGNYASLKKLLPSIKVGKDFMSQLDTAFKGAAEQAAMDDPYKALMVILDNFKETVGAELVPAMRQFYEYLKSPEGAQQLRSMAKIFTQIAQGIGQVIGFVIQNIGYIKALGAAILVVKLGVGGLTLAMKLYDLATKLAAISTKALKVALITTGIGAIAVAVGLLAEQWINATNAQSDYQNLPTLDTSQYDYLNEEKMKILHPDLIPETSDEWYALGYTMYGAYLTAVHDADVAAANKKQKLAQIIAEQAEEVKKALADKMNGIKTVAQQFRDSIGLAFGMGGKDEYSVFNPDAVIAKMTRVANAAKGFSQNLAKIIKLPGGQAVADQLIAMGPAAGNIAAKALLASPKKLKTIIGLQGDLYTAGAQAGAQQAISTNATYEININKSVISASDIIREIQKFEKVNGRKYLLNG
ncbi:MAG: hypothetical protein EBS85_03825 [Micrococcales bacterium]|nr:hypothetical protein [Actinomycetota bacterium]NCA07839.1 hypothetical protein [Micrococcales bacterium]